MDDILQDVRGKIKGLFRDPATFTALLLILVALASFGLGRQSVAENIGLKTVSNPAIEKAAPQESLKTIEKSSSSTMKYVASKKGQVYHLLICPGAKQISEANKIYFDTKEEAEAAGLRPAANCKGI